MSYRFCPNKFRKGFTLVEVLLATTVVAVIAALVVPVAVTNYQKKVMGAAHDKFMTGLTELIDRLTIMENVASFDGTSLYVPSETVSPEQLENSAGRFLRNNFKISKLVDDDSYHPLALGACALLKSGEVFCIYPQTINAGIRVFLDVNGETPPNIESIDIYTHEYPMRELKTSLEVESQDPIAPPAP